MLVKMLPVDTSWRGLCRMLSILLLLSALLYTVMIVSLTSRSQRATIKAISRQENTEFVWMRRTYEEKALLDALGDDIDPKQAREIIMGYRRTKEIVSEEKSLQSETNDVETIQEVKKLKGEVRYDGDGCLAQRIAQNARVSADGIKCKAHKASSEACQYAQKTYFQDDKLKNCRSKQTVQICDYRKSVKDNKADYSYQCSFKDCIRHKRHQVAIYATDTSDHAVKKIKSYRKKLKLEKDLAVIGPQAVSDGFNYFFLQCDDADIEIPLEETIGQLLVLPPYELKAKVEESKSSTESHISINLIWLDSISRPHFYRSLPTVTAAFSKMNMHDEAEILDFELFQAVEGHTAENAHALLTGELFPKHWDGHDREGAPVGYGNLMKKFTDQGYHTYYQDDLCFDEVWGIRLDLGSPGSYEAFYEKLKENFIRGTGMTFSSCQLLKLNGVTNPFNGPNHPLCFNNRFTAEYYLEHSLIRHQFADHHGTPLFSYNVLNVAHDNTGRRVQSVDWVLAEYVQRVAQLQNTITILLSDHGNTYTHYTHALMEGRFEQFHPFLFMVIPKLVQRKLGQTVMQNLRLNQKRLFTMVDLHYTLAAIPSWDAEDTTHPPKHSLYDLLPANRTCDDLDLRLPNLCVCDGWDAEVRNTSSQSGVLEYAVGILNNYITDDQAKLPTGMPRRCHRLFPTSVFNMRERNREGALVTSFDFSVNSGSGSEESNDIFHVEVSSEISPHLVSRQMKVLSYDRLSRFGPYSGCKDSTVNKLLCVCDIQKHSKSPSSHMKVLQEAFLARPQVFPLTTSVQNRSNCLYFLVHKFLDLSSDDKDSLWSVSFEAANVCRKSAQLVLGIDVDNMKTTTDFPVTKTVPAGSIVYFGGAIRDVPYWSSSLTAYDFHLSTDTSYMAIGFR